MIPIIWRFLLVQYLKVVVLCVAAFVSVLLTMRLEDIARFVALDPSLPIVFLFILYQIPYILPIAVPIACLISSLILVQRLSKTHELTALRACGFSLKDCIFPLLLAGTLLSVANFYIVSELSTMSHFATGLWKSELRSLNPLLLLHNKHLMRTKGAYFDTLGHSRLGETAEDAVMAVPNKRNRRISLLLARELSPFEDAFLGRGMALVTTQESDDTEGFDELAIENIAESTTSAQEFGRLIQQKVWKINNDHLQLPQLLSRLDEEKSRLVDAEAAEMPSSALKSIKKQVNACYAEILRRISVAAAPLTFTLMGTAFGLSISRGRSNKGTIFVIALASLYLIAYFAANSVEEYLAISAAFYLVPHVVIAASSLAVLRRISRGIEA